MPSANHSSKVPKIELISWLFCAVCTMNNYSLDKIHKNEIDLVLFLCNVHIRQNDELQELAQTNLRLSSKCTVNRQIAQKFCQEKFVRQTAQSLVTNCNF